MAESELLVFTHIPALYSNLQWKMIEAHDAHFVLIKFISCVIAALYSFVNC